MTPRHAKPTDMSAPGGMLHELEQVLRRFLVLLCSPTVLLLTGFVAGEATRAILRLQAPLADQDVTKVSEAQVDLDVLSSRMNSMRAMRMKAEHTVGVV